MAAEGARPAAPSEPGVARQLLEIDSPLRRRVRRQVGPHPARSLAVRATVIGAAAMAVGWYLGPEDGLVPLLVLAGIGGVLGIRWARTVWERRTVGRRIRRVTGEQPVTLGSWRVAGSGYWLRTVAQAAVEPSPTIGPSGSMSRQGSEPPLPGPIPPGSRLVPQPGSAGGPVVPWAPPPRPDVVPWVPPSGQAAPPAPIPAPWVPPLAGTEPAPSWTVPSDYGWRRATSGIGPYVSGEEVEVLITPGEVWVSGRLVERYLRAGSAIEVIGADGLAITAGDGVIRRWITLVPEGPADLAWATESLRPAENDPIDEVGAAALEEDIPTAALPTATPADDDDAPREAWDGPRAVTDDGR